MAKINGNERAKLFTLLLLMSVPLGLLLGHWMALQVGTAFSAELFKFNIVVAPSTYVYTATGILLMPVSWPGVEDFLFLLPRMI